MNNTQFRDFLRKQVLFEIKTKKMRQTLTEEQIGHIAHALILESDTLNEGLFSAIGSLLGGGVKKVKQFLSRRAVSYLGVSKRSPLYEPLTRFISSMPTKDIYFLYRGDTRHRERLVDILTDETVNILKRDMPDVLGLDTAGSLGGPVVDSVTRVVNTPGFKTSIKRSFNDSFVRFANSEVADMSSIRQAVSDLRGEVGGLSGDIQNLKTQFSARPSAAKKQNSELTLVRLILMAMVYQTAKRSLVKLLQATRSPQPLTPQLLRSLPLGQKRNNTYSTRWILILESFSMNFVKSW